MPFLWFDDNVLNAIHFELGGPLFGRFGDLYGGRPALLLAYLSATLMYLMLGFADSVTFLFAAKLPSLFMHAMQGGQMVATDLRFLIMNSTSSFTISVLILTGLPSVYSFNHFTNFTRVFTNYRSKSST